MKTALFACLVYFIAFPLSAFPKIGEEQFLSLPQFDTSDNTEESALEFLLEKAWSNKFLDKAKAESLLAEAEELAIKDNSARGEARTKYIRGLIEAAYKNDQEALRLFTKGLEKLEKGQEYILILSNRAKLNLHLGNLAAAEEDFSDLLELAELTENTELEARAYIFLGKIAERKNELGLALGKYTEGFRIAYAENDEKNTAEALVQLGTCYVKMGNTDLGVEKLKQALALKQKNKEKEGEAIVLLQLARSIAGKEDGQALKLAKKSLGIGKASNNREIKLNAYETMELIEFNRQNYAEAYHLKGLINQILQENNTEESTLFRGNDLKTIDEGYISPATIRSDQLSYLKKSQAITIALILFVFGCFSIRMYKNLEEANRKLNLKNEELEMSKTALEKFTYAASHDLKEPLRNIGAFSSLLGKRLANKLGEEGAEYIDFIVRGVDQMYNLLDDLRIYSSLFQDNNVPHRQVDLAEVLHAVELCIEENPEGNKVKIDIPPVLPKVMGNPIQMHHLFLNLVNNAIQHNDKPFPNVQIKCEEMENVLLFKVIDNGNGIPEKYHEKIFHAFKRLSRKQKPGSGVGLAVCKKIVEKHHGCIWLDSKVGEGTTFSFTIPRKRIKQLPIFQRFQAHFNKSA